MRELFDILRRINQREQVSMLLVEQNAALALELADHAYLLETGRVVLSGSCRRAETRRRGAPLLPRATDGTRFLHQVLAGLATGGIYASLALALVMIYQATHLVNFAQGEMAMFTTYIALEPDQRRRAVLGRAFRSRSRIAFVLGVADRARRHPAGGERAGARRGHGLHRPAA